MESPVVDTNQGQVQGVRRKTVYDEFYYSFEGIPFAKPPLNELRFRAPQPADGWQGIRDCSVAAEIPVQRNIRTGQIEGSEDCLYVNIYAKLLESEQPLPVLVYIFGGAFYNGDSSRHSYGPDYFMQHDVILVTFNYRLDALGFLSLADCDLQVPGNAGLKDQVLALRWIKHNIANFNGDANNITIFGESAGGVSAHYMMVTEQTRGLFQRAIPMSGCILNGRTFMDANDFGHRLAMQHGYLGPNTDREVLCFLQSLQPNQLVAQDMLQFLPTIEPYLSEDCVVPKSPLEMMKTAWSNEIPMMLGFTSFEGLMGYSTAKQNPESITALETSPDLVLPKEVLAMHTAEENVALGKIVVHSHFGDSPPSAESILAYCDLLSFKFFIHGCHRTVLSRLEYAVASTFLYRFDFDSPDFNFYRNKYVGNDPIRGVAHADDLPYLFFLKESWKLSPETLEYRTIQRMISMWITFAKNSDPNCDAIKPIQWNPLERDAPNIGLNISDELEVITLPETSKLNIWDSLYKPGQLY